jgi:heme/copper-type cytochrome/quinol oxidase subunit 3
MSATPLDATTRARPNAWWGMALFVTAEATLFGTLVGSYFYLRFNTTPWPPAEAPEPRVVAPVLLTAALVLAGGAVHASWRAARAGKRALALPLLALAACVQVTYLIVQIAILRSDIDAYGPGRSAYASILYTLSGASHGHVGLGVLLDVWLLGRLALGITPYRLVGLQATTLYWHVVNALTVVVLLTEVSPRL